MKEKNNEVQLNLKGFSGNKIEVIRTFDKTLVRKIAAGPVKTEKMKDEVMKLKKLSKIAEKSQLFKTPQIFQFGINKDSLFFYDIEFIPAESLDSTLHKFGSIKLKEFANNLARIIEEIAMNNIVVNSEKTERSFLKDKFEETVKNLKQRQFDLKLAKELADNYENEVSKLEIKSEHLTGKSTFCHGDMALDNILLTRKNEIYLIDPLSNQFENKMWDIAKVLQSSMTHWNLIKYNNFEISEKKLRIKPHEHISLFHKHFTNNLQAIKSGTVILYLATTLARVIKYAKNEKQCCALMLITNNLLNDYNDGRYDLSGSLSSLRW